MVFFNCVLEVIFLLKKKVPAAVEKNQLTEGIILGQNFHLRAAWQMSSHIASSPYAYRTLTDILKCAPHMLSEKSIGTAISQVDPMKKPLLLWNPYLSVGQCIEETLQSANIYIHI